MTPTTIRALAGEFLGSALLTAVVIGSGIAAQSLSPTDTGLQLFENAFATALGLGVLILVFQTVSGAHFNPVVSIVDALLHRKGWTITAAYIPAQILGCIGGAILANLMFAEPAVSWSTTDRATWPHLLAEAVATAGLVLVIFALVRTGRGHLAASAVGAYIGAAYFFTSSTSFANPAITIGRAFSDTFAGIAPDIGAAVHRRPTGRRRARLGTHSRPVPRRRSRRRLVAGLMGLPTDHGIARPAVGSLPTVGSPGEPRDSAERSPSSVVRCSVSKERVKRDRLSDDHSRGARTPANRVIPRFSSQNRFTHLFTHHAKNP